jgi:hypothetical protein
MHFDVCIAYRIQDAEKDFRISSDTLMLLDTCRSLRMLGQWIVRLCLAS